MRLRQHCDALEEAHHVILVENLLLVNNHNHTLLAMLGLGAVQPDGGGVVDENGVGWDLSIGGLDWHETREDTGGGGDRTARRIES